MYHIALPLGMKEGSATSSPALGIVRLCDLSHSEAQGCIGCYGFDMWVPYRLLMLDTYLLPSLYLLVKCLSAFSAHVLIRIQILYHPRILWIFASSLWLISDLSFFFLLCVCAHFFFFFWYGGLVQLRLALNPLCTWKGLWISDPPASPVQCWAYRSESSCQIYTDRRWNPGPPKC